MHDPITTYESVEYRFSPDELRKLGDALAKATQHLADLRALKKQRAAEIGAEIEHAAAQTIEISRKIYAGFELREVECLVSLNTPRQGFKEITRSDTMEFVRCDPMTDAERQQALDFDEREP